MEQQYVIGVIVANVPGEEMLSVDAIITYFDGQPRKITSDMTITRG